MAIANPEVEFHMDGFLNQCVAMLNNHYESKLPALRRAGGKGEGGGGWG